MATLYEDIREYSRLLKAGGIQRAYRGIMSSMSGLRDELASRHPEHSAGSLYQGYMDMTYFSFTPRGLAERKLKLAVVYLHGENRLEAWLAGGNRKVQADYIRLLKGCELGGYKLSKVSPGVDSIIEAVILEDPDFDDIEGFIKRSEAGIMRFSTEIAGILREALR